MSYVENDRGRDRVAVIGLVALIQAGLVAALLSGLAVHVVSTPHDEPIPIYQVPEPLPPPPPIRPEPLKHPAPLARTPQIPAEHPVSPIAIVPLPSTGTSLDTVPVPPSGSGLGALDPGGQVPPPPAPDLSRRAAPLGNVGAWFPQDSYPPSALRAGAEGRVGIAVTVLPTGRLSACEVVATSGNDALDQATCRLAIRNGRFQPALDGQGHPAARRVVLPTVRWTLD